MVGNNMFAMLLVTSLAVSEAFLLCPNVLLISHGKCSAPSHCCSLIPKNRYLNRLATSMKIPGIEFLVQALSPKPSKFSTNSVIAAVQDRDESKLRSLISSGIDVNGIDPEIGNGMHWIAEKGHYQYPPSGIPKLLVDAGLDLNAKNPAGSTALEISLLKGWQKIAMLLLDSGADRTVVTESVKSRLTCPDCKKVVRDYRL